VRALYTTNLLHTSWLGLFVSLPFSPATLPAVGLPLLATARDDNRVVGWLCCSPLGLLHFASILLFITYQVPCYGRLRHDWNEGPWSKLFVYSDISSSETN